MVSQEVASFAAPLVFALAITGVSYFIARSGTSHKPRWWRATPLATVIIGAVEVLLYCTVIVR
jgi:hypothetical protein